MHIVYIFTYPYSLKLWKDSGHLTRELIHFKKLNQKYNIKFTLVTYGDKHDIELIDEDFINIIPIYQLIDKTKNNLVNLIKTFIIPFKIKKIIINPDLVIQNQLMGVWVSIIYKSLIKRKFIMRTGYDMMQFAKKENKNSMKIALYYFLTFIAFLNSKIYQVTSNSDVDLLNRRFKYLNLKKIKLRRNWSSVNVPKNYENRYKNKLLSIGRLENQKNYEFLIKNLVNTKFTLDIYGEGTLTNELKSLAKKLNVKVNFLGFKNNEEILQQISNYKYYVTSSLFEGNPKTVLEAMGSGCIVIASNIKNHSEIIKNNKNGYLYELENNSLNKVLLSLGEDTDAENRISKNAYESIKSKNSLEKLCELEFRDFN